MHLKQIVNKYVLALNTCNRLCNTVATFIFYDGNLMPCVQYVFLFSFLEMVKATLLEISTLYILCILYLEFLLSTSLVNMTLRAQRRPIQLAYILAATQKSTNYTRTSMARTSFGHKKFVRDMGSSSH